MEGGKEKRNKKRWKTCGAAARPARKENSNNNSNEKKNTFVSFVFFYLFRLGLSFSSFFFRVLFFWFLCVAFTGRRPRTHVPAGGAHRTGFYGFHRVLLGVHGFLLRFTGFY